MVNYTELARRKIKELINREDAVRIVSITDYAVTIEFKDGECSVDPFGKVE